MKHLIIIFLMIFLPQNIFAQSFFITGEGRGAFLYDTKIAIAEDGNEKPIYMHFKDRASFKVGLGMRFAENWDLGFFYTHVNDVKQKDTRSMANTYPIGKHEFSPKDYVIQEGTTGYSEVNLNIKAIDLELGYTFKLKRMDLRLVAGVKYAEHNMRFDSYRKGDCNDYYRFQTHNSCAIESFAIHRLIDLSNAGAGPKAGVSVEIPFQIENYNFSFIGKAEGSVIVSIHKSRQQHLTTLYTPKNPGGRIRPWPHAPEISAKTNISYTMGLKGGIKYFHKLSEGITLETTAGYYFDGYYGELFTASYTHRRERDRNKWGSERDDVLIHGPFLRMGLTF